MPGKELQYALQMNRYFLIPIGIWPVDKDTAIVLKLLRRAAVIASFSLICFLLIPCALHTFLEEPDLGIKLKLIGPMSFCMMSITKYYSLVRGVEDIGSCLKHVEEDWNFYGELNAKAELSVMRKNAALGRFLTILCAVFMYGGGFFYHTIMPLSSGKISTTDLTEKQTLDEEVNYTDAEDITRAPRVLTYPVYAALMHVDHSPIYEIVFLIQFMSGYVNYTITVGACSLAAAFVVHICGQLEIVMAKLRVFAGELNDDVEMNSTMTADLKSNEMACIVQRHLRALNFATRVEKSLSTICFVEFIGCTMNICFLEYYFMTEWSSRNTISTMTYCILLISFTFNIFIFCYIGQLLTEQCERVGEVAYMVNWYTLSRNKTLDLIMIIIASSHPSKITAGKMVHLSMSSFCNVIKTSATYLNLLRTLMLS